MQSHDIVIDGRSIHYIEAGSGPTTVVLLHGLTDDARCWTRVARSIVDAFTVLAPDARGHGRSAAIGTDGFSVPRLAGDVIGLLDDLHLGRAILVGHSMGAITAATVAAERPDLVRAVVLEDPPLDMAILPATLRRADMRADTDRWRALDQRSRHAEAAREHPEWARVETNPWADAKAVVDPGLLDHLDLFDAYDWRSVFRRLTVAGILLTGDPDRGAIVTDRTAREALGLWPGGRSLRVGDAGHCIHRDRWATTITAIRHYLVEAASFG